MNSIFRVVAVMTVGVLGFGSVGQCRTSTAKVGQDVTLALANGTAVAGTVQDWQPSRIVVQSATGSVEVDPGQVTKVSVKRTKKSNKSSSSGTKTKKTKKVTVKKPKATKTKKKTTSKKTKKSTNAMAAPSL